MSVPSGHDQLLINASDVSDPRFRHGAKLGEALCARSIKPLEGSRPSSDCPVCLTRSASRASGFVQTRSPCMWSIGTPNVRKPQTEGGNFRRFFCKFFLDRVAVFRVDLKTPGDRQFPRRTWWAPHRWLTGASTTTLNEIRERIFDDPAAALCTTPVQRTRRHTAAMLMVQQGANAFLIRQHLGHRSFDSTLAYVNPSDSAASEAAAKAFSQVF